MLTSQNDPLALFVESECDRDADARIPFGDFYDSFVRWCKDQSIEQPPSMTATGRQLTRMGFPGVSEHVTELMKTIRLRKGIRIRPHSPYEPANPLPHGAYTYVLDGGYYRKKYLDIE